MAENQSLMQVTDKVLSPDRVITRARLSEGEYKLLYQQSIQDPEGFWGRIASEELVWEKKWDQVLEWNYPNYRWFTNARMNITVNCLDRHVQAGKRHNLAYIWVGEDGQEKKISYGELLDRVCRLGNALRAMGIKKGDTVTIYMPLMLEQMVAMLACARIGAVHSVVYGGFSAPALRLRIEAAQSRVVITSSWTRRRGKKINLKSVVDEAIDGISLVEKVIVAQREGDDYELMPNEVDFQDVLRAYPKACVPESMDSEDPLFILYTSGTTGKPKGVLHTCGGYNVFTHYTAKYVFDLHEDDLFWCTADPGWVTGHSYIVYGPLSNGATSLMSEGSPDYPDPSRWWKLVERFGVNVFYTAPTAVRMFMKHGEKYCEQADLSSLRILGSVGEPINPEAWQWYHKNIGKGRCTIVDTWWQTETGGHMITTLPSVMQKPGKAGLPMFGIEPMIVDKSGNPVPANTVGHLVIKKPWPSALRTCWGEPERFEQYWNSMPGFYYAGDLATCDEDGYFMILGRADDVLSVSGHRIGTAEVESALVSHPSVAEAAVIGKPHDVKGESIKGFVILKTGHNPSDSLKDNIRTHVRRELGALAMPDELEFVDGLPKTRSGKIMRRVLKAKELGMPLGDTSTLEE